MMPLAKALDVLQSDRMGFSGVLVPTISILLEKMEEMKREGRLYHCNPLVDAIISGIKRRFEYIFEDTRLLTASAAHPMFRLTYIPSDKKAQVVSDLKAEVHLLETQSSGHRQTEDDNPADDDDHGELQANLLPRSLLLMHRWYWIVTFPAEFNLDLGLIQITEEFRDVAVQLSCEEHYKLLDISTIPSYDWMRKLTQRKKQAKRSKASLLFDHLEPMELAEHLTFLEFKSIRRISVCLQTALL
ncbi:Ras guanyl-releasing protein 3 [Collichthys lucidus]|uniref:Ras guanyl-releasing protein 3 n=1 Tax=Collichthys lucidus TaxID=240159 RepID=A0A4U5VBC6_COLLU|nr:Ras guanyl-releasing protein 3 [Collichthys lucidus]